MGWKVSNSTLLSKRLQVSLRPRDSRAKGLLFYARAKHLSDRYRHGLRRCGRPHHGPEKSRGQGSRHHYSRRQCGRATGHVQCLVYLRALWRGCAGVCGRRKAALVATVGRCVVMGGATCCEGIVTPAAEYNIWVDPEAARIVMLSGLPVELVGWHLSRGDAVVGEDDIARILGFNNPLAKFAIECNSHARKAYKVQTGEDGISLPDPVAMSIALDPSVGTDWSA